VKRTSGDPPPAAITTSAAAESTRRRRHPYTGAGPTLRIVCAVTALLIVQLAGPNVALPDIARDVGASFTDLQWVLSGYTLALAVVQLTAGSLADRRGRRLLFCGGLLLFAAASLLCAVAPSAPALIVARVVQGLAAGVVFPSSLALLVQEFHGSERRRAIGLWGAVVAAAYSAGPLIGGVLVELASWRWFFGITAGCAVAFAAVAQLRVRETRDPASPPVDWAGVALLSTALFMLVFAILRGNALGWDSAPVVALLAGGIVLLAAFAAVERRVAAPMLDLGLLRNRTFDGASLAVALGAGCGFAVFTYMTLFFIVVQDRGALETGVLLLPLAGVSFVAAAATGRVQRRLPLRPTMAAGFVIQAAGLVLLAGLEVDSDYLELLPGLVLAGAGIGLINPLATVAGLSVFPPERGGLASALNNTARQLGVALGIAVLGAILQAHLRADLEDPAGGRGRVLDALSDGDLAGGLALAPEPSRDALRAAYDTAYGSAVGELLLVSGGLALAGAVVTMVLVRQRDLLTHRPG
jgi:EmrB/QacA subfamily drug resistance transporter